MKSYYYIWGLKKPKLIMFYSNMITSYLNFYVHFWKWYFISTLVVQYCPLVVRLLITVSLQVFVHFHSWDSILLCIFLKVLNSAFPLLYNSNMIRLAKGRATEFLYSNTCQFSPAKITLHDHFPVSKIILLNFRTGRTFKRSKDRECVGQYDGQKEA